MPFLKSKLNLLNIAVVATSICFLPAVASANPPAERSDNMDMKIAPAAPLSGGFLSSDLNNDGVLNMSEFTLYAGDRAVAGDQDYTAVVATGDYDKAFKLLDADASGNLSEDEVTVQDDGLDNHDMTPKGEMDSQEDY